MDPKGVNTDAFLMVKHILLSKKKPKIYKLL